MKTKTKDLSAKDGIASKPLANVFEVWIAKRQNGNGRVFRNALDQATAVYLANKRSQTQTR